MFGVSVGVGGWCGVRGVFVRVACCPRGWVLLSPGVGVAGFLFGSESASVGSVSFLVSLSGFAPECGGVVVAECGGVVARVCCVLFGCLVVVGVLWCCGGGRVRLAWCGVWCSRL